MSGSLGHFGGGVRNKALRPVPRSLTVCAGDLCGRLAGGSPSNLQTFVTRATKSIQMQKCKRVILELGNDDCTQAIRQGLRAEPQNLSEEFDPGSE